MGLMRVFMQLQSNDSAGINMHVCKAPMVHWVHNCSLTLRFIEVECAPSRWSQRPIWSIR